MAVLAVLVAFLAAGLLGIVLGRPFGERRRLSFGGAFGRFEALLQVAQGLLESVDTLIAFRKLLAEGLILGLQVAKSSRVHPDLDGETACQLPEIVRIGSENGKGALINHRHDTVRRLYRGLMVLKQAEDAGLFDREDRYNTRFAYSHLWTGLGYTGIQEFLGLTAEKGFNPNPVPKGKLNNLKELCLWLYGSKEKKKGSSGGSVLGR